MWSIRVAKIETEKMLTIFTMYCIISKNIQ